MMFDEWGISDEQLKYFEEDWTEVRNKPSLLAHYDYFAIYDIGKSLPILDKYYDVIQLHCEWFWYWPDNAMWDMRKGVRVPPLPTKKPFERPKFDSEAMEKKLKEQGITAVWHTMG